MLNIVLVEPEIPHNTGAIARTCAATGARLHLVKPLGFDISDKMVKRCGLDYWPLVDITVYENLADYFGQNGDENIYLATTKGSYPYTDADFTGDVSLLFGKETEARSLNLSNSVAVIAYEALRQQNFPGLRY